MANLDLDTNSRIWKYASSLYPQWYNDEFLKKLNELADKRNVSAQALLEVFLTESGLLPNATNGAFHGIGQISGYTIQRRGITTQNFLKLTPLQQLSYIDSHFDEIGYKIKKPILSSGEFKRFWFLPAKYINNDNIYAIKGDSTGFYEYNTGFDKEKKGYILAKDVEDTQYHNLNEILKLYGEPDSFRDKLKETVYNYGGNINTKKIIKDHHESMSSLMRASYHNGQLDKDLLDSSNIKSIMDRALLNFLEHE